MPRLPHRGLRAPAFWASALLGVLILTALGFAPRSVAADAAPVEADLHTFTNDSGATFKAQITGATGDEVSLKREDGVAFHPKVSLFSKEDQTFIRVWAAKNAAAHGAGAFSFHATSVKGVASASADAATHRSTSAWKENYNLEIKNLVSVNWPTLHFRYIIFKQSANPGKLPPEDFTLQRISGTIDVDKYTGFETKTFPTDKVTMQETGWMGNYFYLNGAPKTAADKFKGIWIRVYDDEENLFQEWASDPDIIKSERWTFPRAAGARGAVMGARATARGSNATAPRGSSPSKP